MINNDAEKACYHDKACYHVKKSFDYICKIQDDMKSLKTDNQQLKDSIKLKDANLKKLDAENTSLKESIQDLSAYREASSKAHELQIQGLEKSIENLRKEVENFRHELQSVSEMGIKKDGVIQKMEVKNRSIREEIHERNDLLQKKEEEIEKLNKQFDETYQFVKRQTSAARKRSLDQASCFSDNKREKQLPPSDNIDESSATNKVSMETKEEVDDDSTVTMDYSPFHSPSA
jgi:chromosome segregation ATPase